jgi:hypothetical protein
LLGLVREINQVFALVGRAGAERYDGEPIGPAGCRRLDVARINRAQSHHRWQHSAERGDGDEYAVIGARHRDCVTTFGGGHFGSDAAVGGGWRQ